MLQISNESVELEELREMKADVERREKAQAAVLERQAKRLEELETLYKVSPPAHIDSLVASGERPSVKWSPLR